MELYSVKDVARILKISYATALKRIHSGEIKTVSGGDGDKAKRGAAYLIRKDDLDEYRKKHDLIPDDILTPARPVIKVRVNPPTMTLQPVYDTECVMKTILRHSDKTYYDIGKLTGSNSTVILGMMNGKTKCTHMFIDKFAKIFGIDTDALYNAIKEGRQLYKEPEEQKEPEVESCNRTSIATDISDVEPECSVYYAITCYVRTKDGLEFDNVRFQKGHLGIAVPVLFKTREEAENYILETIRARRDKTNNSGCFYDIYTNEKTLVAYKTVYDICKLEVK